MTRAGLGFVWALAASSLAACTGDIIDDTAQFPGAFVAISTTLDPPEVNAGTTLPVTATVSGVFLLAPSEVPPVEHRTDAAYLVYTLDDEASTPLLVTAETESVLTIPASTTTGPHTIICRVFRIDGTPSQAFDQLTIGVLIPAGAPITDSTMDTSFPLPQPTPPPTPVD
jgi:hypothetical protein